MLLSGFNGLPLQPCTVQRPARYENLLPITQPIIARGQGCSYGDAALNADSNVALTNQLKHFLAFDREEGIIFLEAGITIGEILKVIVPQGWFLPVIPGTQHASLGGCIATDVHGKNHVQQGSFGQQVLSLELVTAQQTVLHCSPTQHADIFWATIGGMGLTGIIYAARLKLIPIVSSHLQVTHHVTRDLEQTLSLLNQQSHQTAYNVAWLDLSANKYQASQKSGIVMSAQHSSINNLNTPSKNKKNLKLIIPCYLPNKFLNQALINSFNKFYRWQKSKKIMPFEQHYQDYFFPLDAIQHWQRLYGKRKFLQYQCVLPDATAANSISKIIDLLQEKKYPITLATLKRFGNIHTNNSPLSFPITGFTLALDIPVINNDLFAILDKLDVLVANAAGRVYLAKDLRLKPEVFREMYPRCAEWLAIKHRIDPYYLFRSDLSRRLDLF